MSTPTRKISEIATQADALTATDRVEITQGMSTTPVTRYATPGQIADFVAANASPRASDTMYARANFR
jgi:hypothetical protein